MFKKVLSLVNILKFLKRLSNQLDDKSRLKYAHYSIDNSDGKNLELKVDDVLKQLIS
jgi:dephospho-CoA kinase